MTTLLVAVLAAVLVSAFCSLSEAALYSVSWSWIERLRKEGRASGELLYTLRSNVEKPITAILTLNTIANTAGAAVAGAAASAVFGPDDLWLFTALFTVVILVAGEIVPKTMLALSGVVLLGTLWPLISALWSKSPVGLDAGFYNRVCLPLFALVTALVAFCPHLSFTGGVRDRLGLSVAVGVFLGAGVLLYAFGIRLPVPLFGSAAGVAACATVLIVLVRQRQARSRRGALGAYLVHLGLGLVTLGVAISGPYQVSQEAVLTPGRTMGSFDRAKAFLDKVVKVRPEDPDVQNALGVTLYNLKDIEGAKAAFEGMLARDPEDYRARYNLGLLYKYALNQPDKAAEALQAVADNPKTDPKTRETARKELEGKTAQ